MTRVPRLRLPPQRTLFSRQSSVGPTATGPRTSAPNAKDTTSNGAPYSLLPVNGINISTSRLNKATSPPSPLPFGKPRARALLRIPFLSHLCPQAGQGLLPSSSTPFVRQVLSKAQRSQCLTNTSPMRTVTGQQRSPLVNPRRYLGSLQRKRSNLERRCKRSSWPNCQRCV